MSKYIIDIPKTVGMLEKVGSVRYTYFDGIQAQTIVLKSDEIEELNSDYINEHFGDLQDVAYKRGFEDGKASDDKGCDGCAYVGLKESDEPCVRCSKCYKNQYRAKKKDDEINVGDEVDWDGAKFVVTRIFKPYNQKEQCDGVDADGCVYAAMLIENLTKTGRRFDVIFVEEK